MSMHRLISINLFVFIFLLTGSVLAQNIFLLEKPGTIKNKKYYVGDQIKIRTIEKDTIIEGVINKIFDSVLIIDYNNEVRVSDIKMIYTKRWGFNLLKGIFQLSGFAYLGISSINGLINNDKPILPKETLIISGGLIIAGFAMVPLANKRHIIDQEKWRVKTLIFD